MPRPKNTTPNRVYLSTTVDPKTYEVLELFGDGKKGKAVDWLLANLTDEAKEQIKVKGLEFLLS